MGAQVIRAWIQGEVAAPLVGIAALAIALAAAGTVRGASASAPPSLPTRPVLHIATYSPPTQPAVPAAPSGLHRFTAAVGDDLSVSLRRAGVPEGAARDYVAQMLRVQNFASEVSVADRFDLVVADLPEGSMLVYAGMDRVGRGDLMFLKYGDGKGRVEWVDAHSLERRGSGGLELPVGGRVTSGFGLRMHPLLGYARFHRGIDLAAAMGTPIRAAADGKVVFAGWRGGYGRQVALDHGGGLDTSYGHMSRILAVPGERVTRGQIIGLVGSSGLSTGPHVHFEVRRGGQAIDPRSARIDMPVAMSAAQRAAFDDQLRFVLVAAGA